jgi:oligopeptide/dipeptide ABC transporter ATP-binding protein
MTTVREEEQATQQPILAARDVEVAFRVTGAGGRPALLHAVAGVSFSLNAGETLAIVGESGCGKTTVARAIVGLVGLTGGSVSYRGQDMTKLSRRARRALGSEIQMVFQDPNASLNPRMTVQQAIAEAWIAHPERAPQDRTKEIDRLLDRVGLRSTDKRKLPHEFSGGQRQRIVIARALAVKPHLLVLDEPVSALDVSIQAQILSLLTELQQETRMAYIMISHDLDVVATVSDRVLSMYLGRVMEMGDSDLIMHEPCHPYTEALLAAAPDPEPWLNPEPVERVRLSGEMPSPLDPPSGCRLHGRCWLTEPVCVDHDPELVTDRSGRRAVACHVRNPSPTLRANFSAAASDASVSTEEH